MRKQTYTPERATAQLMAVVADGLQRNRRLADINADIRALVNSYNGLNRNERAKLFNNAYSVARRGRTQKADAGYLGTRTVYDSFMGTARRINVGVTARRKHSALGKAISDFDGEPIFYLCSHHTNCAPDHLAYQGKVYVDRFWRTKVSGVDYYKVLSYIKNRKILTIQQIVKSPVWLTTRPNCKHYFTPIRTDEVLQSSPKRLLHRYNAYHYSQDEYDYYRTRQRVFEELNRLIPCEKFACWAKQR